MLASIGTGYAYIKSNLNINGTANVTAASWDVHFENVQIANGSVTASTAPTATGTNTTSLTYTIALQQPGDFYEFTVDVKNGGSIAAKLNSAPTISGVSTAQDVYTNYTFLNSDGSAVTAGQTLAAGAKRTYKVRVEFDSNISASQLPSSAQNLILTVSMPWVQS